VAFFYRWRGGNVPWYIPLIPLINAPNRPLGMLNLPQTLLTAFGTLVRGSPLKMGLFGLISDVAAPWLGPNMPIFGGLSRMVFLSWPMVGWRRVEMVCIGFWPYSPHIRALICLAIGSLSFGLE
jgi:hypothetical protein